MQPPLEPSSQRNTVRNGREGGEASERAGGEASASPRLRPGPGNVVKAGRSGRLPSAWVGVRGSQVGAAGARRRELREAALAAVHPRRRRGELCVLFLGLFVPGREGGRLPGGAPGLRGLLPV